jgi:hypothetical protein
MIIQVADGVLMIIQVAGRVSEQGHLPGGSPTVPASRSSFVRHLCPALARLEHSNSGALKTHSELAVFQGNLKCSHLVAGEARERESNGVYW